MGRAVRVDSTVIEADIRYPSDAMLALQGTRALAREGRELAGMVKGATATVRDRSRSVGRTVRQISRRWRGGRGGQAAGDRAQLQGGHADRQVRPGGAQARRPGQARGAGPWREGQLRAAAQLEQLAERCEKVSEQISRRARGLKITDRLVSIADPDARPIRKGKLGKPTEFGYVAQIAEVTENTPRRPRLHPAGRHQARQPGREHTAPGHDHRARGARDTAARAGLRQQLPSRSDPRHGARGHQRVHLRPPRTRIPPHPQAPSALPHRHRGPHQPPQAQLRAAQPAKGPSRPASQHRLRES